MRGPDPPQDVSMEERVAAGIAVEASSSDGKGGGADRIGSNKFVVAVSGVVASSSSKSLHAASYEADDGDDGSDGSSGGGSSGGSSSGGSSSGGGSDAQSNATGTSVDEVDDNDDDDDDNESCCSVYETDEVALLGEIVSGFRLTRHDPGDDVGGDSDDGTRRVFCRIRYGSASVHRTECAKDSGSSWRNPIWTLSTQSLFVIHTTPRELAHTDVVVSAWFQRRDPLILTNETSYLGEAKLTGTDLVRGATEERVHSLTLHDGQCHKALDAFDRMSRGTLNVRFRLATPADEAIVKMLGSRQQSGAALAKPGCFDLYKVLHAPPFGGDAPHDAAGTGDNPRPQLGSEDAIHGATEVRPVYKVITEKDEAQIATNNFVRSLSDAFLMVSSAADPFHGDADTHNKVRVKPHPDPHPQRAKETAWMSPEQIRSEVLQPSHRWLEAGSGTLGKLYLEILSCHNLPNVDVGEAVGNFTDAFVCAVFEDAMVQTPVIYDELSPHWMPWTDRAFCFGVLHPASMLHLGVFDYDLGPMLPHEPLGRATVNVAHFQRDTDYTLRYNLYKSADITDRSPMGSITVRLRVTYHDEKRALLAALGPRPKFHINVRRDKSHSVVRYTCFGEYNRDNKFEMTLARSYINEILEYKRALSYCVADSAVSILFWQGQVRVAGFYLPLHSFLLFVWGTVLLERPQLFPSFLLLSVAWILLATQTRRQQHPSPWRRCPSFWHYAKIMYFGSSTIETKSIGVNEGASEAQAYEQQWQERLDKDARVADARCAFQEQMTAFDESIHTKTESGWDPDLLVRLARYQRYLATVCRYFRLIKLVVTWEESILSFWITACFLVGGILSLLLPWSFILFWTGRLFVYGLLGPHMKIVGMVILGHSQHEKDDEAKIQRILETFRKQSLGARLRHQEAVKLKDVLRLSFGPFSTLTPALNLSRHYDYPLSVSHAQARSSGKTHPKMAVQQPHVPGQYCRGIMVPRCGVAAEQFREEMPHLERLRESLQECIQCIHDQENSELVRRLRSIGSNEGDIPEAVGYELISLLGLNGPDSCHKSDTSIVVGESSSLHLNATLDVAVMAVRRRNGPRNSMRTSQRIEVVTLEQNAEQESQLKLGPTSTLLHSNDPRLAILETSEHRLSLRRSLCYKRRLSRRSKKLTSDVRLPECELPINDEQLHTGGVEVIWEDPVEESEKSTVHNSETRNHVPGLQHTIIPMEPELVYQREDDNFVQYYKLLTPSRIDAGPMHHEEHLE